jgi:hypothetical protein
MRYQTQRRRRSLKPLAILVALVWIVLLGVLAYQYYLRPQISQALGEQIAGQLGPTVPPLLSNGEIQPGGSGSGGGLPVAASGPIADAVAALPVGELNVTDDQINEYLATNIAMIQPAERMTVLLRNGEIEAQVRIYGVDGVARTGLAVQNGKVVTVDPRIEGALGNLISAKDLFGVLEQQINAQLDAQGRQINELQIGDGVLIARIDQ